MNPNVRSGLLAGAAGAVLNVVVAAVLGICGPFVSMLVGAAAGFLAVRQQPGLDKNAGGRNGAIAGGVAGAVVLLGQVCGAMIALYYIQSSGQPTLFGSVPSLDGDPATTVVYYLTGAVTGMCFGVVGIALAALGGLAAGYLTSSS